VGRWPRAKCLCRVCPCFNDAKEIKRHPESMLAGRKEGMAPVQER